MKTEVDVEPVFSPHGARVVMAAMTKHKRNLERKRMKEQGFEPEEGRRRASEVQLEHLALAMVQMNAALQDADRRQELERQRHAQEG